MTNRGASFHKSYGGYKNQELVHSMQESLAPESYPVKKEVQSRSYTRVRLRRMLGVLGLCAITLFVFMLGSSAFHGWSVYRSALGLQTLAEGELDGANLSQVQTLLDEASDGLIGLDSDMWFWRPILERLSWVPRYGPTLVAAPDFVAMGKHLGVVGRDGVALVAPLVDADLPLSSSLENVSVLEATALFAEREAEFVQLAEHVEMASKLLAAVEPSGLEPRLVEPVYLGQQLLPVAAPMVRSLPYADELVGREKPQTILILVQNNDELRATGGFISAFGRLVLEQGSLAELKFADSYWVQRDDVEYAGAPKPMQQYMGTRLMTFRDANWSPDFPTTAQAVKGIFRQDTGVDVDGVVTVDMRALQLVIDALAPLHVEGLGEDLNGDSVVAEIKQIWDRPVFDNEDEFNQWWAARKALIPMLADAILARVLEGSVNYVDLALVSLQALDARSVQVWIDQPKIADELARLAWDGSVSAPEAGDFIGLVDTNLGYNKVDSVIERAVDYEVAWAEANQGDAGRAMALLTVTYDHPVEVADHRCDITPRYGTSYDDMAARCYFNYVRLYVPSGSELIGVDGVLADSVESRRGEGGTQVFSGYFVLPPGDKQDVTFTYYLPEYLSSPPDSDMAYALSVRRQSGTKPLSLTVDVSGRQLSTDVKRGAEQLLLQ